MSGNDDDTKEIFNKLNLENENLKQSNNKLEKKLRKQKYDTQRIQELEEDLEKSEHASDKLKADLS